MKQTKLPEATRFLQKPILRYITCPVSAKPSLLRMIVNDLLQQSDWLQRASDACDWNLDKIVGLFHQIGTQITHAISVHIKTPGCWAATVGD